MQAITWHTKNNGSQYQHKLTLSHQGQSTLSITDVGGVHTQPKVVRSTTYLPKNVRIIDAQGKPRLLADELAIEMDQLVKKIQLVVESKLQYAPAENQGVLTVYESMQML